MLTYGQAGAVTPPGTQVTNVASASFEISGTPVNVVSNTAAIISTVTFTRSEVSFYQFVSNGEGAQSLNASGTTCSLNSPSGPFVPLSDPEYPGTGVIDASQPMDLAPADTFHQGEPVFIRLYDPDRNLDSGVREHVQVTVRTPGVNDVELLEIYETSLNSGEFIGYIQSAAPSVEQYDCVLAVDEASRIAVEYTDPYDPSDVSTSQVLVDPFGVVFNSATGEPVNGATVTVINTLTNQPATVFGDDGVSAYPNTVVTGSTVTDSSGRVYNFDDGAYRFPFMAPGTYRLDVTPGSSFSAPSTVPVSALQNLPNAPFAIDPVASFGGEFRLNAGPPLNIDYPVDPVTDALFLTKQASREVVALGDFIQYRIEIANTSAQAPSNSVVLTDILPIGFRYRSGSSKLDGERIENPQISANGRTLQYTIPRIEADSTVRLTYVLEVTAGTPINEAINQASAVDSFGSSSNVARAIVNVRDELLRSQSFVAGQVLAGQCDVDSNDSSFEGMTGVGGVRLLLEDGRYVITDDRGMYHFEGLRPGTHIIQIDEDSIPETMEVQECVRNTRFAGTPHSRFLELRGGLVTRANFFLKNKSAVENRHAGTPRSAKAGDDAPVSLSLNSRIKGKAVWYSLGWDANNKKHRNQRLSVILDEGLEFVPDSATFNSKSLKDPQIAHGVLTFRFDSNMLAQRSQALGFKVKPVSGSDHREYTTSAMLTYDTDSNKNQRLPAVKNTLTATASLLNAAQLKDNGKPKLAPDWLDKASAELEWVEPVSDFNPSIPSLRIGVKHAAAHQLTLTQNDRPVSALNFEGMTRGKNRNVAYSSWRGVDLDMGKNRFVVTATNRAGKVVGTLEHKVHFAGVPRKAVFLKEQSTLIADGRTPVIIAIQLLDKWGKPARPGLVGRFRVEPPHSARQIIDAQQRNPLSGKNGNRTKYKINSKGIVYIELEPTTQSGKAVINLPLRGRKSGLIEAWLKPAKRDWILVGLAESTVGYRTLSGNSENIEDAVEDRNLYQEGRLAFYAKGQVKGKWLLTMAYDSDGKRSPGDRNLHQVVDPDELYTLYGDATEQRFDAASAEKLYLKLEREQFYALFGDYETGMTVTELSRYSRSMTGIKTEFDNGRFELNGFASSSDLAFVRDEIQGNGTSGLYRLSRRNIIVNSDKITIETRDRFRSELVLVKRTMRRHSDYDIDARAGTLFFKRPVFSRDENLNPMFIVAEYEVDSGKAEAYTAGGRGAVKFMDEKLELGVSVIHEGDTGNDGELLGADVRYNINDTTELRAEMAVTDTEREDSNNSGAAYLVEMLHKGKKADARAYIREQEEGFGIGQQNGSETGTRKLGADGRYRLSEQVSLNGEVYREQVTTTRAQRDVAATALNYQQDKYSLSGGFRHARDRLGDGSKNISNLVTAGASRSLLEKKLKLRANAEVAVGEKGSSDYPTRFIVGSDYLLTPETEMFAEHEFTQGEFADSQSTRVGLRAKPWSRATLDSSIQNQVNENGPRLFATLGLTQSLQVSEALSVDIGFDRTQTMRDSGNRQFNTNVPPASGTINNDFTAFSIGANYNQDLWSLSSRVETRFGEQDDQYSVTAGFYRQQTPGLGFSLGGQHFDSENRSGSGSTTSDVRLSFAYRPDKSRVIALNRLDLSVEKLESFSITDRQRKMVNNLTLNWLPNRKNQFALHHGIKYTMDSFDGDEYDNWLQVIDSEYRHDINRRFDIGIQTGLLHSINANNYLYSLGASLGVNLIKNLWVSLGYNFDGFEDEDFSSAGYTAKGPYIKMRFAFDQHTVKDTLKWFDKK